MLLLAWRPAASCASSSLPEFVRVQSLAYLRRLSTGSAAELARSAPAHLHPCSTILLFLGLNGRPPIPTAVPVSRSRHRTAVHRFKGAQITVVHRCACPSLQRTMRKGACASCRGSRSKGGTPQWPHRVSIMTIVRRYGTRGK
jgi:hypothetical protein